MSEKLVEIIEEYAEHASWRCAHPPHFYLADGPPPEYVKGEDCPCGLVGALRAAGLESLAEQFTPRKEER